MNQLISSNSFNKPARRSSTSVIQALRAGPLRVSVIGSGNWGTVIARVIARNVLKSYLFSNNVRMWVYEEQVDGRNLTDIINNDHENVKYLPGIKLPENIVAIPDLIETATNADLLVFVIPHQFIYGIISKLQASGVVSPSVKAVSLLKGLHVQDGQPMLFSSLISESLGIDCCVLSGANVASGVAREEFSESTIGFEFRESGVIWQELFHTSYFRISAVPDIAGVSVCGAVKNVIALAAGFCDGMKLGSNTKSAIIRIGIEEMKKFASHFFQGITQETFFDSAGLADVITTCFGGRNVRCAAEFVLHAGKKSWDDIEKEMLNGQKLQGTLTTKEIYEIIEKNKLNEMFPLFIATYRVAFEDYPAYHIIEIFENEETLEIKDLSKFTLCSQI